MGILTLRIKRRWFDKIVAGEKTEEYRRICPHYQSRLSRRYDAVRFFTMDHQNHPIYAIYRLISIRQGPKPSDLYGSPCFILQLGERLE
jgi:hypothetical protein